MDRLRGLAVRLPRHVQVAVRAPADREHLPRALLERLRAPADVVVQEVLDPAGERRDAGRLGGGVRRRRMRRAVVVVQDVWRRE